MSLEITYQDPPKCSNLGLHIESYTSYYFSGIDTVRFFPEGRFELIFQMDAHFLHRSHLDSTWLKRPYAFVGGLHDRAYHVKPLSNNTTCIGIKFKPDSAKYFIPRKLNTLKNRVVSISDIWNKEGRTLLDKIKVAPDHRLCFYLLDQFLARQFKKGDFRSLEDSCSDLQNEKSNLSVRDIARKASLSTAQFRKIFRENIGISPSEYRKIIRVSLARNKLKRQQFQSLTDLAINLGYFDQAHFIREFKSITGLTPSKYFASML